MARIRSLHPEQWSDEDFVELSHPARLLAIGIRNHADDSGIFEWKPKSLKMRIFPADDIDVVPLLAELEQFNQVRKFELDGKDHGAIRNFRKWQRPRKPNERFKVPDELRTYLGLEPLNTEPHPTSDVESSEPPPTLDDESTEPVPHQYGKSISEEGCRRKEVGGSSVSKDTGAAAPPIQEDNSSNEAVDPFHIPDELKRTQTEQVFKDLPVPKGGYKKLLFGPGLEFLIEVGNSNKSARSALGKWLKDTGDDPQRVWKLLAEAHDDNRADPIPWVMACLKAQEPELPFWANDDIHYLGSDGNLYLRENDQRALGP